MYKNVNVLYWRIWINLGIIVQLAVSNLRLLLRTYGLRLTEPQTLSLWYELDKLPALPSDLVSLQHVQHQELSHLTTANRVWLINRVAVVLVGRNWPNLSEPDQARQQFYKQLHLAILQRGYATCPA